MSEYSLSILFDILSNDISGMIHTWKQNTRRLYSVCIVFVQRLKCYELANNIGFSLYTALSTCYSVTTLEK